MAILTDYGRKLLIPVVIKLDPQTPLPCSIYHPERGICGQPALGAYAYEVEPSSPIVPPGQWIIQPVCSECAEKAARVYSRK